MSKLSLFALRSSSKGNATLIHNESCNILIDCGISGKVLDESLLELEIDPRTISAILITHEHSDHTKGVGIVARKYNIPIYATFGTWECMKPSIGNLPAENIRVIGEVESFMLGGITVTPFPIPHDAAQPVGYVLENSADKVSVVTDLGIMTEEIFQKIKGSSTVLLESNYDLFMLEAGTYPYDLKRRIKSNIGHLCNDDAALVALDLAKNGTKEIILGHISPENNYPDIALKTTMLCLESHGFKTGNDISLCIAQKDAVTAPPLVTK